MSLTLSVLDATKQKKRSSVKCLKMAFLRDSIKCKNNCNKVMALNIQLGNKNPSSFSLLYCNLCVNFIFLAFSFDFSCTSRLVCACVCVWENFLCHTNENYGSWVISFHLQFIIHTSWKLFVGLLRFLVNWINVQVSNKVWLEFGVIFHWMLSFCGQSDYWLLTLDSL